MKRRSWLMSMFVVLVLALVVACGDDEKAAPGVDTAALAKVVQEAVQQAASKQVSAEEIQRMVEAAVAAAAPETATPAEIKKMVEQAVTAAAKPGATKEEMESLVSKAVADSAASIQPGVSASEVQKLVSDALKAVPTPQVQVVAPPTATPAPVIEKPTLLVRDVFFTDDGFTPPLGGSFFENRWSYAICEGLTAIDTPSINRGNFLPARPNLAHSWTISPDGKTYVFQIRNGVQFTTGRPLDANAVKRSIEYTLFALDNRGTSGRAGWTQVLESIEATGTMELTIKLQSAYAPLIANMAAKSLFIVDADELLANQEKDDQGNDDRGIAWGQFNSACTGPFMIESWEPEQRLVLKANPTYWGGHDGVWPEFGRVIISHIPENATAELQVGAGEVDIGLQLDPVSIPGFESGSSVKVYSYPSLITCNFLIDRRTIPLQDDRVFQAVRYAVDYEGVRDVVAGGLGDVHQSLVLPGMQGHDPAIATRYNYDPAKAKELLAEAGYPDGFDVDIHLRTGSCGSVPYQKALEFFQNNLKEVGINATIVQSTSAKFWGAIIEETFRGMGISGLGAAVLDGDNPASIRATGECFMLGLDDVDPEAAARLTELTELGRAETSEAARHEIYKELSSIMVDKCGEMTVLLVRDFVAYKAGITGLVPAPHAFTIDFRYLKPAP